MIEKLRRSSKSTNFWNNFSTIGSTIAFVILVSFINDPETVKQMVWAFMASTGLHNTGNILAHVNSDK